MVTKEEHLCPRDENWSEQEIRSTVFRVLAPLQRSCDEYVSKSWLSPRARYIPGVDDGWNLWTTLRYLSRPLGAQCTLPTRPITS